MPLVTMHHVVPDADTPVAAGAPEAVARAGAGTTVNASISAPQSGLIVPGELILVALVAVLLLLTVAAVYAARREPPRAMPPREGSLPGGGGLSYTYPGARARLRQAFVRLRRYAERRLERPLTAATAWDLARSLGGPALEFAARYSRLMYSRQIPTPRDVEDVEGIVDGIVED